MKRELPFSNTFEAFRAAAEKHRDKTAVVYLGTRYSYARMLEMVEGFAWSLRERGIGEGDRGVLYLPNCLQWVIAWLGTQRAGAEVVPITPIYTVHDLAYIANDSRSRFIVCADTNYGYVKQALDETGLTTAFVSRLSDLLPWWKRFFGWAFDKVPRGRASWREGETFSFRSMVRRGKGRGKDLPPLEKQETDTMEILYTGGTTKFPKGVPISHGLYLESALEQIVCSDPLFPAEKAVVIGTVPLFHILGQTTALSTLLMGGTIVRMPKVNLDAIFNAVQRYKANTLIGVPTLYRMILEHDRLDMYDLKSLAYCFNGGDVLPVEVNERWRKTFGRPIYQGYGATETCGGVSMCPTDRENPVRSIGRVVPSKEIRIVDTETLEPVEPGTPGELLVHSDRMVRAYWNKPEETAEAFIEMDGKLFYRTADVISQDEEGNLYFVDRTVDTIKHKGYRVSSSEVESVLQEHPSVIGACVVGLPDEKVGERIKAFVVLKEDVKGITGYDLIRWCRGKLVNYKIPQHIEFRDMLPKSKVGKLLRREIRSEEKRRAES